MDYLQEISDEKHPETNPLIKFLLVLLFSLLLFALTNLWKIYLLLFSVLLIYRFGSFRYNVARPRIRMILVFSGMIFFVQVIFYHQGTLLFFLIPKISDFGPYLPVYQDAVFLGLLLLGRFLNIISVSWIFVNSTNPFNFARSLTAIKVPYRIAYTLSLALRFAPVFTIETGIIQKAQNARGLNTSPRSIRGILNVLRFTLIPLIGSTLERIKDITISMEGRGFGAYTQRTYMIDTPLRLFDIIKLLSISLFLLILYFI